ncbi:MAG: biotin carboxylase N-terminal domain-containing protein [Egibacteraceae bacterium]
MFDTVLVAGRGEIALRIIRTLRHLGISPVAVYSDADAGAPHTRAADTAVRLGPAPALDSYLRSERVLEAAAETGAQAVHPGYGFLSESPAFARACARAGLAFIGPPAEAIEAMGDKIRAKRLMEAAGVPVLPGLHEPDMGDDELVAAAGGIGFPLLVKPAAGGGGKGMRLVRRRDELPEALASARREALAAFGDGALLLERFVDHARHIEIQLLADAYGATVHLGERECSLQRRHQKIVEEAPSPLVGPVLRERLGACAIAAARACGYCSAGTVEFVVEREDPDRFFFLEMNTRLQVEHPVTEMVTGLDLVEWQVRIAAGQRLDLAQDDVRFDGHAVEARVYAEDPTLEFLPTGGRVVRLGEPPSGDGVRVDSSLGEGVEVGSHYDPMLAKVIAWGEDRQTALRRLDHALAGYTILGVATNIAFLRRLLADPEVRAGRLDTGLVEERLGALVDTVVPADVLGAAGLAHLLRLEPTIAVHRAFDLPGGWRIGEAAWELLRLRAGEHAPVEVRVRGRARKAQVAIGDAAPVTGSAAWVPGGIAVTLGDRSRQYSYAQAGDTTWLGRDGAAWALRQVEHLTATGAEAAASGRLVSPMPGTVSAVHVAEGDQVTAGQTLLVVEAMKMEHPITAPTDGVVTHLHVHPGQQVVLGQTLAVVQS